jgi:hypothetical protein
MWRYFFALFVCLGLHGLILKQKPVHERKILPPQYAPAKGIEHFALGYKQLLSDVLWLQAIQHMDTCNGADGGEIIYGSRPVPVSSASSAKENMNLLFNFKRPVALCTLGWVFQMMDRSTDADPRFTMVYLAGATDLSVIIGDREGATRMYEKGLKAIPHDWRLEFRAAYHYLFELGDTNRAAELLIQAGRDGAPSWVFHLAARIYGYRGQLDLGRVMLESTIAEMQPGPARSELEKRLAEVRQAIEEESRQPSDDSN